MTVWSRLEALGISTDFLPGVLAARWLEGGIRFGLGSTLAMTQGCAGEGGRAGAAGRVSRGRLRDGRADCEGGLSGGVVRRGGGDDGACLQFSRISRSSAAMGSVDAGLAQAGVPGAGDYVCVALGDDDVYCERLCAVEFFVAERGGTGAGGGGACRSGWGCCGMDRCCGICGCCRCGISSGWGSGRGALPGDTVVWRGELFRLRDGRISPVRRGYPPLLPGCKSPLFNIFRRDVVWQNIHSKWVTAKIFQSNELAPGFGPGALLFSLYCFKYSWSEVTNTPSEISL